MNYVPSFNDCDTVLTLTVLAHACSVEIPGLSWFRLIELRLSIPDGDEMGSPKVIK